MIPNLQSEKQRIEHAFKLASGLPQDEEILSHWARYLCVLTSGLIESGMRVILSEYARTHASTELAAFAIHRIEGLTNLNAERIKETLGTFSEEWREEFERSITDAQKDAIDSVVANRHQIAHGRPVGISLVRVKDFYERVSQVIEWTQRKVVG